MISNKSINDEIIKILPYGSVTQCTNNEKSDVEMTIYTKNYENATDKYISNILENIKDEIKNDKNEEFEIVSEKIRQTKRMFLLELRHKESKTEIELNCNNFFGVMNSALIRNYLVYEGFNIN